MKSSIRQYFIFAFVFGHKCKELRYLHYNIGHRKVLLLSYLFFHFICICVPHSLTSIRNHSNLFNTHLFCLYDLAKCVLLFCMHFKYDNGILLYFILFLPFFTQCMFSEPSMCIYTSNWILLSIAEYYRCQVPQFTYPLV